MRLASLAAALAGLRRVKYSSAEVLVAGTITQHVIDGCQDRRGNRDCCLLGAVARFETEELGLKIAVLLTRCAPRSLHQYGLGDLVAGEDDLADLALRALKRDDKLLAMAVGRERPRRRAADRG